MTPGELKKIFEHDFAAAGIESAAVDAARLISEVAGIPALEMYLHPEQKLDPELEKHLCELAFRRCQREPLQYLTGKAFFRDAVLEVTPAVLIPRPETELLAGILIERLPRGGTVLDLGTGSGAIAVSIAGERPDLSVTAADLSLEALEVAERNASANHVDIRFLHSDLFSALGRERFDGIAANLPYVTCDEYQMLEPEVKDHEPVMALVAEENGFALIRKTVEVLPEHLKDDGIAIFELSPFQAPELAGLLTDSGFSARIIKDLTGRDRFVMAEKK